MPLNLFRGVEQALAPATSGLRSVRYATSAVAAPEFKEKDHPPGNAIPEVRPWPMKLVDCTVAALGLWEGVLRHQVPPTKAAAAGVG